MTCHSTKSRTSGSGDRKLRVTRNTVLRRESRSRPDLWARVSQMESGWRWAPRTSLQSSTDRIPRSSLIDHHIYAIVSDGDLMEGVASEAASLAGHLKLGKLIYLYDDNQVTIEGF